MNLLGRLWNASPRSLFRAMRRRLNGEMASEAAPARWVEIPKGPLAGRKLWLAPERGTSWREMADGVFDEALLNALNGTPLQGCTFWDIGAHLGYYTLAFAAMGGPGSKVIAFEPNPFNREQLARNLEKNPELSPWVEVAPVALAARDGEMDFVMSPEIESGMSSCSFLEGAQPPRESRDYANFLHQKVPTVTMDRFARERADRPPDVLKIDVEGGEQMVLDGGKEFLAKHKPVILMEVHNIQLMFSVQKLLIELGFELELIDDAHSSKSRCFVVARPRRNGNGK